MWNSKQPSLFRDLINPETESAVGFGVGGEGAKRHESTRSPLLPIRFAIIYRVLFGGGG